MLQSKCYRRIAGHMYHVILGVPEVHDYVAVVDLDVLRPSVLQANDAPSRTTPRSASEHQQRVKEAVSLTAHLESGMPSSSPLHTRNP